MTDESVIEKARRALELDALATSGPWQRVTNDSDVPAMGSFSGQHYVYANNSCLVGYQSGPLLEENADFIAAARTDYPALARAAIEMQEDLIDALDVMMQREDAILRLLDPEEKRVEEVLELRRRFATSRRPRHLEELTQLRCQRSAIQYALKASPDEPLDKVVESWMAQVAHKDEELTRLRSRLAIAVAGLEKCASSRGREPKNTARGVLSALSRQIVADKKALAALDRKERGGT